MITSKAANGYHFKTGQRKWPSRTRLFYSAASCGGKSVFVRQLRGPHLSTCPWCSFQVADHPGLIVWWLESWWKRASGNKSQAARLLALSPNALRYRLSKIGIDDNEAE